MKTNYVPSIIMLSAGFICCLISIQEGMDIKDFIIRLLIVLVIFFIIGSVVRFLLDRIFKDMKTAETEDESAADPENEEASETSEESEDIKVD